MYSLVFMIAALVLFLLATLGTPSAPRFNLQSAGLACATAALLLQGHSL